MNLTQIPPLWIRPALTGLFLSLSLNCLADPANMTDIKGKSDKTIDHNVQQELVQITANGYVQTTADGSVQKKAKSSVQATIIEFVEQEQGIEPYSVTYTINTDWMRIDDTPEKKDFVLFDRQKKIIYSINSEVEQVVQIQAQSIRIKSPIKISNQIKVLELNENAPKVAGNTVHRYQFIVNTEPCVEMATIKGILNDELKAIIEFKKVMAGQHSKILEVMPGSAEDACDLSRNIFQAALFYSEGFPVVERDFSKNFSRVLKNYRIKQNIEKQTFEIPDGLTIVKM